MADRRKAIRGAADLVADIERRIAQGALGPGDRLAPVRAAATELGLAPNTVAAAYRSLGDRGSVVTDGRRGTFVAQRGVERYPPEHASVDGLVDLAQGNPDPTLLPSLVDALSAVAADDASWPPTLYGADPILPPLAALLRADLAADGIDARHLAVVGGALDGIERALATHLRPGDRVGVEDPGYPGVIGLVQAMGYRSTPIAVDPYGPRPDAVTAAIAAGVAAIVVTPRASNPTGAALDAERADALRRVLAAAPDVVVIEDDHASVVAGQPYHRIVPDDARNATRRWVTVRSVAKALGPDLRLAALAGDQTTVDRLAARQSLGTGWVSTLLQRLVVELMGDPGLGASLAAVATTYAARRRAVVDVVTAAGHVAHGRSGLNVWVPVADEAAVVAAMQRAGYALRSGAPFRLASPPGVRISTAAAPVETLRAAANELVAILDGGQPTRTT